jgi:TIGR00364: exsB protein
LPVLGKKTFPQSVCFKLYLWTKACEGSGAGPCYCRKGRGGV